MVCQQADQTPGCDIVGNHDFGLQDDAQILQRRGAKGLSIVDPQGSANLDRGVALRTGKPPSPRLTGRGEIKTVMLRSSAGYDQHGLLGNPFRLSAILGREPRSMHEFFADLLAGTPTTIA